MAIKEDFKNLETMLNTMNENVKMLDDLINTTITDTYNLDISIREKISVLTEKDIEDMTEDKLNEYLSYNNKLEANMNALKDMYDSYTSENEEESFLEYSKKLFKALLSSIIDYNTACNEKDKIAADINSASEDYFNYVNSAEYKQKKMDRLNDLRQQAENEEDPSKKKAINKMLDAVDKSESLHFLYERLDEMKDFETESITSTFFNSRRSTVVMNKFKSRMKTYGYNGDIYKMFFNIEEKFLPEEYHVYNNLFLFNVMRFVSYTDTHDKRDALYTSAILVRLYNLIYHKFQTQEEENAFIELIKKIDDYFVDYKAEFEKENSTAPNHPERIERDKEYEMKRRVMVIAALENEGITPDTRLSTNELRDMLQEVINKKTAGTAEATETTEEVVEEVVEDTDEAEPTEEITVEEVTEESTDNEEVVEESETSEPEVIEVYRDVYNCMYVKDEATGSYNYVDENFNIEDNDFTDEDICRLLATGSVTKVNVTVG